MSRPGGTDLVVHPGAARPPLFGVMIGCGIAGVLIAIGAAVVDFGTGKHPGSGGGNGFGMVPGVSVGTSAPARPSSPVPAP